MRGGFPGNAACQHACSRSACGQHIPHSLPSTIPAEDLCWSEAIHCQNIWQSSMHLAQSKSSGYRCQADAVMRGGAAYRNSIPDGEVYFFSLHPAHVSFPHPVLKNSLVFTCSPPSLLSRGVSVFGGWVGRIIKVKTHSLAGTVALDGMG